MRVYFLLLILVLFSSCKGQNKSEQKVYVNKDFNWTISIPSGFDTVSAANWAKMQNRGAEAIENTYDAEVINNAKTIFVFKSDQFNYFESNYQPFDTTIDGDYLTSCKEVNSSKLLVA
jgi:hypothetical protein